jgi:Zn-finger nucleic acid-binding protein
MQPKGEERIATRSDAVIACPKCTTPLYVALCEDVEVDSCPSCHGVWVDVIEEKIILQITPKAFTVEDLRLFRKLYQPPNTVDPARYVPCPVCGKLMHRKVWGSHSGVIVDKCYDHGTWYDAGELEKVREFVALGGVEFEKLKLTERGLQELEGKLNHEVARLDRRVDSAYRRARLWSLMGF